MPETTGRSTPHPLELLDAAREHREQALPGLDGPDGSYRAHLSALGQLIEIYFHRLLKPFRLSASDFRVLSTLRVRPREYRATPQALNGVAQMTSAGMTRTLDRLEDAGFVDRIPNPEDRRSILVGLTDSGWEFAESVLRDLDGTRGELLGEISEQDRKAEIEALRRIISRVSEAITSST